MKKAPLLAVLSVLCLLVTTNAQNVFDPNDPVVNYDPSHPPATPPANTLSKWIRTPRPEVTFNTDRFKAYYYNGMPFRLRFPNGYNPNDPNKKYPVILFFHGIGEAGFDNDNDIQLAWGAQYFESKINEGQFDAFLLFPLTDVGDWSPSFPNINSVLDLLQVYCHTDPDRLITMGLSLGGDGTMKYTFDNPQRSAISIASSPGSISTFTQNPAPFIHVPFWIASGGLDAEFANPAAVQAFVDRFSNAGGDVRWTFYPDKGHGTWPYHWYEPQLIPYWQSAHKANPLVFYKQTNFPASTPFNVKMGITGGFAEYQWQRNNADIGGAGSNEITVSQPGTYRVRFRRTPGGNWSDWSPNPAVITQPAAVDNIAPSAPANLHVASTTTTSITLDWDNSTDNVGVAGYDVFINGTKQFSTTSSDLVVNNLSPATTYTFTVQAHDQANNFSAFSNAVNGTTATVQPPVDNTPPSAPANLHVVSVTTNTIVLDWDNSSDNVGVTGYDVFVNGTKTYSTTNSAVDANNLSANTTYSFTVQAHDGSNNFSGFSNAVNGTTASNSSPGGGLTYKFYQGAFNSLPNFSALTPVQTGTSSNVDLSVRPAGINDNFAFVWEGNITISTPGTYTFETVSDDGSKFYFNSSYSFGATALVNNDGLHAATSVTGTVNIPAAGTYPIAITFFERDGGEGMQVFWSGPGFGRQPIPGSAFGGTSPQPTNGLSYKYYEGSFNSLPNFNALTPVKSGSSSNVDISVRTPGINDNFAFVWEGNITISTPGTYTFETVSDDGSRLYFNSLYNPGAAALVNNDGLHAASSAFGTVTIPAAGSYPIAITFFEQGGGEVMQVYWSGPGFSRQPIPNSAFTSGTPQPGNGLNYKYYEGSFNSLPNFSALAPVKTGSSSNVDLGVRTPGVNDNFAFVWEGNITITTPGTYTFETVSDDGSKLYFNTLYSAGATALVNNDGLHAPTSATGTVNIPAAGTYPIAITYFEKDGGENMQVYWTGPGIPRQLIPNSAFTGSSQSASGLNYKYYEGAFNSLPNFNALTPVKTGASANADLGIRTPGVNDNFAFVWEGYINITTPGNYTFETISDDGSKLYFNSFYSPAASALVNNDGLHAPTSATGTVNIPSPGLYPIAVTFFERDGGETMQVYWSGPGIGRQLIPNSAFRTSNAALANSLLSQGVNGSEIAADRLNTGIQQVYPNPFISNFTIYFNNTTAANKISVDLIDVSGRVIVKQDFGSLSSGPVTLKMNVANRGLVTGVYFARVSINGKPAKLIKLLRK